MKLEILVSIFCCLVAVQFVDSRNYRHETIIKRRLSEVRTTLEAMKSRQVSVLLPLEDAFLANFTAMVEHGDHATAYLLRNAHFEIENIELQASKRGIHVDTCVADVMRVMTSFTKATADDIIASKEEFLERHNRMYEYFVHRAALVERDLREAERLQIECHLETGCFDIVMAQIDRIDVYVNADFVNDFKLQVEAFMMKMQRQYHAIQGFYLTLYDRIKNGEKDFRVCYKQIFQVD